MWTWNMVSIRINDGWNQQNQKLEKIIVNKFEKHIFFKFINLRVSGLKRSVSGLVWFLFLKLNVILLFKGFNLQKYFFHPFWRDPKTIKRNLDPGPA